MWTTVRHRLGVGHGKARLRSTAWTKDALRSMGTVDSNVRNRSEPQLGGDLRDPSLRDAAEIDGSFDGIGGVAVPTVRRAVSLAVGEKDDRSGAVATFAPGIA